MDGERTYLRENFKIGYRKGIIDGKIKWIVENRILGIIR